MTNIYASRPDLLSHDTYILKVRTTLEGRFAIVLAENILRPAGGGQPQDFGVAAWGGEEAPIGKILKVDGETWLEIDGPMGRAPAPQMAVQIRVDAQRRNNLSRCHSLTHLGMAAVKALTPGYESKGAEIAEDGGSVTLRFLSDKLPDRARLVEIDRTIRSMIARPIPIRAESARSLEAAAQAYPYWRVDPDNHLSGKIRIIHIEGVDANPCSGSHVADTQAIGPFEMGAARIDGRGVTTLRLARQNVWMSWYPGLS